MPDHHSSSDHREGKAVTLRGAALLKQVERRNNVLKLRRRGLGRIEIADAMAKLGDPISDATVRTILDSALNRISKEDSETTEQLRVLENQRLDDLLATFLPQALRMQPDHKPRDQARAAAVVLKTMERRARLNGLDAAQEIRHSGRVSVLHELGVDPAEIERERQAFETAYGERGLADPYDVEGTATEVTEITDGDS
ncbi:hypothetical protein [Mycobacterium sp.]|uniref:hypothetical protein n=1 Tax=Mycobacterium sp. TaxID=1785 RepID=UPI002633B59D|nr:hypothetical protein [Mycobacterium sp.]